MTLNKNIKTILKKILLSQISWMDGIIKETLSNTDCSLKVPSEVIQKAEEEEISDNEKSDEGNRFDMFEFE